MVRGRQRRSRRGGEPVGAGVHVPGRLSLPRRRSRAGRLPGDVRVMLVDLHAEATSDKQLMGRYLDGRVTAVLGTHTHVPTADEQILPGGTAFQCDVGMTGPHESILGRRIDRVLETTRTFRPTHFEVAADDVQIHGTLVERRRRHRQGHQHPADRDRRSPGGAAGDGGGETTPIAAPAPPRRCGKTIRGPDKTGTGTSRRAKVAMRICRCSEPVPVLSEPLTRLLPLGIRPCPENCRQPILQPIPLLAILPQPFDQRDGRRLHFSAEAYRTTPLDGGGRSHWAVGAADRGAMPGARPARARHAPATWSAALHVSGPLRPALSGVWDDHSVGQRAARPAAARLAGQRHRNAALRTGFGGRRLAGAFGPAGPVAGAQPTATAAPGWPLALRS